MTSMTVSARTIFFDAIRKPIFSGSMKQSQVDGCNAILDEWAKRGGGDVRHLAYILATALHETAATMKPIAEYGRGKGHPYGKKGKHGQAAYGRGYVQLTWDYNYEKADKMLGLGGALIRNYELALRPDIAAAIMFRGMAEGWFTGKALGAYIAGERCEYRNARKVINGLDKAALIAGYASDFEAALRAAGATSSPPSPPFLPSSSPDAPVPTDGPPGEDSTPAPAPAQEAGFLSRLLAGFFKWLAGAR